MKKKAKYSLILIVVLVVVLGVGFGIWKIFFAPKPLKIKDLEDAHITTTRSSKAEGWFFQFNGDTGLCAYVFDNSNVFGSDDYNRELSNVWIGAEAQVGIMAVQAGDTLEIIYDGGQTLTIYLPAITMSAPASIDLFIATDGSTYYDRTLTQLAWSPDSAEPLRIKDLEKARITTTRSSAEGGWIFGFLTAGDFAMGSVRDNSNYFDDEMVCETTMPFKIEVYERGEGITVRAGDTLEITYDEGQNLIIYMPEISEDGSVLYVATDGSTYYDRALTQLAQSTPSKPDEETKNE